MESYIMRKFLSHIFHDNQIKDSEICGSCIRLTSDEECLRKPQGKSSFLRSVYRWVTNIKMDLEETKGSCAYFLSFFFYFGISYYVTPISSKSQHADRCEFLKLRRVHLVLSEYALGEIM